MRIAFSLFLMLGIFNANAQLLDPAANWFGLEDFFDEQIIKDRAITHLDIKVSSKSDGKIIKDAGEELHYAFNASGKLLSAEKRIPLYKGYDTARVRYQYDKQKRLIRKQEHYGPYRFEYVFQYTSDSTFNSIKLRPSKSGFDTLYFRYHKVQKRKESEIEQVANRKGVVFQTKERILHDSGMPLREKMEYVFSKNKSKTTYDYSRGKLIEKHFQMDYGKRLNSLRKLVYEDGKLKEVRHYEKGAITRRITFTFSNGLPTAAVVRFAQDKVIKIYLFEYTFY